MVAAEHYCLEADDLLTHLSASHPKQGHVLMQWVVPKALKALVLKLCHDDATAAHAGIGATHLHVFERYYWPGMSSDIRTYVLSCLACQLNKGAQSTKYPVQPMPPKRMWQRMHIDLMKISVPSDGGHTQIMCLVEARSGYLWLRALRTKETAKVADHLLEILLDVGALPEEIVSDQGTEFTAAVVADLCRLLRTRRVQTSSYHPQSNGVAEAANSRLLKAARSWVNDRQTNWHVGLPLLQYALRNAPRGETGLTPFFCVYGREARLPHDAFMAADRPMNLVTEVERNADMMALAERVVEQAFGKRAATIAKRNENIHKSMKVAVGDWVLIKRPPQEGRAHKIDSQFTGPWQVMGVTPGVTAP